MKRLLIFILLIGTGIYAQGDRHEKIKALKTAYITEQLDLSSAEAEKFWPVYNVYEDQMMELRQKERREVFQMLRDGLDAMSDAEANALLDKAMSIKTKELEYNHELVENLRKVLSPKKIIKLKKVEEDFKRQLLDRYKQRKKNR